jgi:23S rRNA pseudouridine1911/1915/1917 synthase
MTTKQYTVSQALDGARLDKALVELAEGLSRAQIKRAIDAGAVRVEGRRRPKGALVAAGEAITIEVEGEIAEGGGAVPTPDAPLVVRFASDDVLVVDKPAGQPSAPLRPGEVGTLANALVGHYPELARVGYSPREPGLVHRLDTDTSGLLIVARNPEAFDALKDALRDRRIEKSYLLVCAGENLPDEGSIEFPLANHPKDQRRVYACVHPRDVMRYAPRPAKTRYAVEARKGGFALVRVFVAKALRHQIRAHFAAIEHPLAGDTLYGGPAMPGLARHALHAEHVRFDGDGRIGAFDVRAPLPDDMAL